ncbi:MAG: capsular biosynthesis protein [Bacteroidia bacterium]|nr:capsular biosynthesis protein [Bacteroidia bacterium]
MLKNILSVFSAKNHEEQLQNYSEVSTDIHSHFIPGIDDGCKTIDESVALIRSMIELGFRKLITTPHIMSDNYQNTPEIILSGLEKLKKKLADEFLHIELEAAAEYYLDDGFLRLLAQGNLMSFGSEKYLLVEVSYINYPENFNTVMFDIIVKGYTPVLAHPERYPFWSGRFEDYSNLKSMGVLFQLNTNSLAGYYGPDVKKTAQKLVALNMIDFIGSDTHHDKHINSLRQSLKNKYLYSLVKGNLRNKNL